MSFLASIKNAPKEAVYWMPAFYYIDPITGAYTPYYPGDYLDIIESWLCPLSAGEGILVDYRCIIYDANHNILDTKDLYNIKVKDSKEFTFNWGGKLNIMMIAIPVGFIGLIGIAMAMRRR